jgi:hypothetical protein
LVAWRCITSLMNWQRTMKTKTETNSSSTAKETETEKTLILTAGYR